VRTNGSHGPQVLRGFPSSNFDDHFLIPGFCPERPSLYPLSRRCSQEISVRFRSSGRFRQFDEHFIRFPRITIRGVHVADDHELWERIKGRDASAFEAFYRENATRKTRRLRSAN